MLFKSVSFIPLGQEIWIYECKTIEKKLQGVLGSWTALALYIVELIPNCQVQLTQLNPDFSYSNNKKKMYHK